MQNDPKNPGPTLLKDLIERQFHKIQSEDQKLAGQIQKLWPELVGSAIAKQSRILYLKKSTLYVTVKNSAWLFELNLLKPELLQRLQDKYQAERIADLKFQLEKAR